MASDIFERLEQDHTEMREMFSQLSEQFDDKLFEKLETELIGHSRAEEEVFYDAVVDNETIRQHVLEGYEEHHVADLVLRELTANEKGTERWMAKLSVLQENVEHHITEEEGEVFDRARQIVSPDQANQMVSEFEAAKKKHSS